MEEEVDKTTANGIPEQIVREIADQAAKQALKDYKAEERKKNRYGLKNKARKLMANYNSIKAHVDEGVSEALDASREIDFMEEDLSEDSLYIISIRRSRIRSMIMVAHIDKCMEMLKYNQEECGAVEKYYMFYDHYMNEIGFEQLGELYSCSDKTARRWVGEMESKMSVYLFGADAVDIG